MLGGIPGDPEILGTALTSRRWEQRRKTSSAPESCAGYIAEAFEHTQVQARLGSRCNNEQRKSISWSHAEGAQDSALLSGDIALSELQSSRSRRHHHMDQKVRRNGEICCYFKFNMK